MKDIYTHQSIKDRIVLFLNSIEEPISRAEKKCGFSVGYLRNLKANPSYDKLESFFNEYPQLSRHWLLSGAGSMTTDLLENNHNACKENDVSHPEEPPKDYIPLLPSVAHGGRLTDFSPSNIQHKCEMVVSPVAHADFAIQVLGDSMEPQLLNGSRIFVKRIDESLFLEWGKIYVIDTPNGVVVKKVMPTDKEGIVECVSVNPAYPSFKVDMSKAFGVYRVLAIVTMY